MEAERTGRLGDGAAEIDEIAQSWGQLQPCLLARLAKRTQCVAVGGRARLAAAGEGVGRGAWQQQLWGVGVSSWLVVA